MLAREVVSVQDKGYPAEANVVAAYCGILANLSHAEVRADVCIL